MQFAAKGLYAEKFLVIPVSFSPTPVAIALIQEHQGQNSRSVRKGHISVKTNSELA
jgi:hypothetical protein